LPDVARSPASLGSESAACAGGLLSRWLCGGRAGFGLARRCGVDGARAPSPALWGGWRRRGSSRGGLAGLGSGPRGGRLECRDHGRAGDPGGSRGRSPARTAGIKDQFMIMEPCAGDRPATAGASWHGSGPRGRRPECR